MFTIPTLPLERFPRKSFYVQQNRNHIYSSRNHIYSKINKWAQSNPDPFKIHSHMAEDQKTHI